MRARTCYRDGTEGAQRPEQNMVKRGMVKRKRWVVKAGSKMVCAGGPLLMRTWMHQVSHLRKKHGIEVIWVSSGAIAWAVERTDFNKPRRTLPQKQALS